MQWSLILYAVLLICHFILYSTVSNPISLAWFGDATQWIGLFLGAMFIGRIAKNASREDFPKWMYVTFGVFVLLLGQTFLTYSELLLKRLAYGSISDVFWFLGFCSIWVGLIQLAKPYVSGKEFVRWMLIGAALYAVVLGILWADLMGTTRTTYLKFLDLTYSFMEIGMFILALIITLHAKPRLPWKLATISLAIYLATDTLAVYYSDLNNPVYRYLDIPYFIGVCAWWLLGATYNTRQQISTERQRV